MEYPAARVNNDSLHNGADQFFQWLVVDPSTGSAYVVFYDRRGIRQSKPRHRARPLHRRRPDLHRTMSGRELRSIPATSSLETTRDRGVERSRVRAWAYKESRRQPRTPNPTDPKFPSATPTSEEITSTVVEVGVADFGPTGKQQ